VASYSSRVKQDIARWIEAGLIDAATGDSMARDVETRDRRSISFGTILAAMAALLLGAAILIFVAANWEAIPRIARVGALFSTILAAYVGGAILKTLDHGALGEAVWLVGAAAFGASIALIGQMYHLSGDEAAAVLTWCIGTGVAAAALRSSMLTIAAVGLAVAWLFLRGFEFWTSTPFPHAFVVVAAALWAVSLWTDSRPARHLLLLGTISYVAMAAADADQVLAVASALALVSAGLFAFAVHQPNVVDGIVRLDGRFPVHALIGFLVGMFMVQAELIDDGGFAVAAAIAFAGVAAALTLGGRESRGLRWLAYLGFAIELAFVYLVMVGTMLGTAGFFLAAAVILGLVAYGIIRVEKRMKAPPMEGAAA
jgi:uncharacterized membrane protein